MRRYAWAGGILLGLVLFTTPTHAVVMAPTPLGSLLTDDKLPYIVYAKVDAFDPEKLTMILTVDENLKGKAPFTKLPVNLKSRLKSAKEQTPVLLKRLAVKLPVVVFMIDRKDGAYLAYAYTNGTWFGMQGITPEGAKEPVWLFTEIEPYLRRTFKGTTAEMRQTIMDAISGKKAAPPWDEKEKPGVGPEVEKPNEEQASLSRERSASATITIGPTFAVIPSVVIGGPLAILAMLFPAWFGGWRRWFALISGLSTASTVIFVYWLWGHHFALSAWGGNLAQWLIITVIIILSAAWAWQRHLSRLRRDEAPAQPSKAELVILGILAVMAFGTLAVCWKLGIDLTDPSWLILAPMGIAAIVGMVFAALARQTPHQETPWEELDLWTPTAPSNNGHSHSYSTSSGGGTAVMVAEKTTMATATATPAPHRTAALATEVVMLTAMAVACTALAGVFEPRGVGVGAAVNEQLPVQPGKQVWMFRPDDSGMIASSPLVAGDRIFVGAAIGSQGVVFCLDRASGKVVWDTQKTLKFMKRISISSPVLADGKLYIGEGFHQESNCMVWCLDAATGKEVWSVPTGSHTESSPFVADGKVFIGAGDDGMYCLDARTGDEKWHFKGLHIDANPIVHKGRVYVGAGEGDVEKETAIICLDADNGNEIWKHKIAVPAWGSPVLAGDLVYFGIGNGTFDEPSSKGKPVGALLCVNASDGTKVWTFDTNDGVLCRPSVDRARVWFGSRDGHVYCLDRRSGKLHWKRDLKSPVVTAAALAKKGGLANAVYVLASEGQAYCLEPNTGAICWQHDLTDNGKREVALWSSPELAVIGSDKEGERRQLIFGARLGIKGAPSPAVYCFEDRLSGVDEDVVVESRP